MDSTMMVREVVISDLRMSARPSSSGLMAANLSAMSACRLMVQPRMSLVISSLVILSCWSWRKRLAMST